MELGHVTMGAFAGTTNIRDNFVHALSQWETTYIVTLYLIG